MRHNVGYRKLGRTSSHRAAMFRNQLLAILEHERIVTTLIKAKELRPIVEKMITLGKKDSVHTRRQAAQSVSNNELVTKLFTDISPRFAERPGGYTRIIKLGPRRGDGAEMAILEFVDFELEKAKPEAPAKGAAKKAKGKAAEGGEATEAAEPKKKAAPKKAKAAGEGAEAKPKKAAAKKTKKSEE